MSIDNAIKFDICNFGEWLTNEMTKSNITITELEYRSGVTQPSICNYRRNYRTPQPQNIEAIINALGYELVLIKKGE